MDFYTVSHLLSHTVYSAEPSEKAFIELAKKLRSSVVNISTTKEEVNDIVQIFPGYFMPFNLPQMTASGSGFIVDQERTHYYQLSCGAKF